MTKEVEEQIKILNELNVTNYIIENDKIIINENLYLNSLKELPHKNFLNNVTINGGLYLAFVTSISYKNFLNGTTIHGHLHLDSLTFVPKNFINNTTITFKIFLKSLKYIHKDVYSKIKNKIVTNKSFLVLDDTSYNILDYNGVI